MKIISYNINSILRGLDKGFGAQINEFDMIYLQETKINPEDLPVELPGYHSFYHCSEAKRGYSGVSAHTRIKPKNIEYKFDPEMDNEGRFILCDFKDIRIINIYTPNAKDDCSRMDYQMEFCYRIYEKFFRDPKKKILFIGDINLAHQPSIDVGSLIGKPWWRNPINGTQPEQVLGLDILENDYLFVDLFRLKNPGDGYHRKRFGRPENHLDMSWFSSQTFAKPKGLGWRVDYVYASYGLYEYLLEKNWDIRNLQWFAYSDHVPIEITLPYELFM